MEPLRLASFGWVTRLTGDCHGASLGEKIRELTNKATSRRQWTVWALHRGLFGDAHCGGRLGGGVVCAVVVEPSDGGRSYARVQRAFSVVVHKARVVPLVTCKRNESRVKSGGGQTDKWAR